jgi:hypothetical protein
MNLNRQILFFFLFITLVNCGSFQSSSYFSSDGIYNSSIAQYKSDIIESKNNTSKYYSDYFQNLGDDYSTLDETSNQYFVNTDSYSSNDQSDPITNSNQVPWGDETSKTEIYIFNHNIPWYNNSYSYSRFYNPYHFSPYSNHWGYDSYYGNHMYYGLDFYNQFYSPYRSFYSPYSYYYPYYNQFYYGNYRYPNNRNSIYPYSIDHNNRISSNISKSKTNRGEKNSTDSKSERNENAQSITNETEIRTVLNRLNVGRGRYINNEILIQSSESNYNSRLSKNINSKTKRPVPSMDISSNLRKSRNNSNYSQSRIGRIYSNSKNSSLVNRQLDDGHKYKQNSKQVSGQNQFQSYRSRPNFQSDRNNSNNNYSRNTSSSSNYSSGRSYNSSSSSSSGRGSSRASKRNQ